MPDQKLAAPYGDIVFVNTPNLDRMGAMIYNEEKQRKAAQAKADADLDNEFSKNIAGIRSVDVTELTTKYDAMKRLKQSTYNTNKLSTKERIALQQEAIKATADTYQTINQSKEAKTLLGTIQADQKKNPNNYAPEYTDLMVTALSLPTNKLRNFDTGKKDVNGNPIIIDFTNPDTYAYKLGSTDFSKEGKFAMGDIKQKRGNTLSIDTPDKMGTINVEYTGINSPDQYLSNLQHSVVGSKKTSDFIKEAQPLIADEANIINSFDELTKTEAFKNAYPDFKGFNPMLMNTELGKAMILSAMKAHIISPPREVKSNPIPKWKKREDYKEALWNKHNKITFNQSLQKIAANKKAQQEVETPYLTDDYWAKYGKGFDSPEQKDAVSNIVGFTPLGYVNSNDIHPTDLETITGQDEVEPIIVGGKSGFLVDENGDWIGAESKRIPRESVRNVVIEKRANTKHKIQQENKKNTFAPQKAKKEKIHW